jgi:hypothetical protein
MEGLKIDEIMAQIPDAPAATAAPVIPPAAPGQPPAAELKPKFTYGDEFEKAYPKK